MTKHQFLLSLHKKLAELPQQEVEERLHFYSEMIEDRMEDGLSEEDAVAAVGSVGEIAVQIASDIPVCNKAADTVKPKPRTVLGTALVILGSPLWICLLIAIFAVVLSLYVCLWSVVISLWAVFASMIGCALGGAVISIGIIVSGHTVSGIAMIGAAITCAGISVLMFIGSKAGTKGVAILTKKIAVWIKNCFMKKEDA